MRLKANQPKRRPPGSMEAPAIQPARRLRLMYMIVIAAIIMLTGCGQQPATPPTVQAAATQIVGTVQSAAEQAAPTVQAARTEIAPTVVAAQTEVRATLAAGATEIAPTVQAGQATLDAARTQIAPTVVAARTEVRATLAAGATEIAPTVQAGQATLDAVRTQIAPTVQVIATAVAATIQPPIATSVAASPIQIANVSVSQEDTTIGLSNKGTNGANVSSWILLIGTFPLILPVSTHLRIEPNKTVMLHFSRGTDTDSDVYVGQAPELLVNSMKPGTRFVLINLQGELASIYQLP